jgi:hypothetical protein
MLIMDHPFLAAEAPPGVRGKNCAQALLGNKKIMPILDGLDEIPGDVRAHAIAGICRWCSILPSRVDGQLQL